MRTPWTLSTIEAAIFIGTVMARPIGASVWTPAWLVQAWVK
jgi:hypothetical protein